MVDAASKGRRGPGVRKSREQPLFQRGGEQVRAVESRWRALIDGADAMSEGAVRNETDGRVWYGSTSLLVALTGTDSERAFYVALASRDIHVRTRAIRTAVREAESRAPGALGKLSAEFRVSEDSVGLRIDVEVQAPLIERRRRSRAPGE